MPLMLTSSTRETHSLSAGMWVVARLWAEGWPGVTMTAQIPQSLPLPTHTPGSPSLHPTLPSQGSTEGSHPPLAHPSPPTFLQRESRWQLHPFPAGCWVRGVSKASLDHLPQLPGAPKYLSYSGSDPHTHTQPNPTVSSSPLPNMLLFPLGKVRKKKSQAAKFKSGPL